MKEVYRKFGRAIRREDGFLVRVEEKGEAIEETEIFTCRPIEADREIPQLDASAVNEAAAAIERIVEPPLALERLIVSEGIAFHEFGGRRWSESTRRIHLSIARAPHRALIDLAEFSTDAIRVVAGALARVGGERPAPRHIRLAGSVGAALLPMLTGAIPMQQWEAPHDGKGERIANVPVTTRMPPNWFRPSYRARPLRSWFHLRADPEGDVDRSLPAAIALLAPIHGRTARVLCVADDAVFTSTLVVDRIAAAAPSREWYPYAAGCFGVEIML